jgi:hypothetical protein
MAVNVIVRPKGLKATPAAIAAWKASAQQTANDYGSEVELKGTLPDGTVESHLIAAPQRAPRR